MASFEYLADGHHVDDAGNLIACTYVDFRDPAERFPITTLQKASSKRHAIPRCETIRISKPAGFLDQGEGLASDGETHHGTNGWIYCASIEPETAEEQAAWRRAMPAGCDAVSPIRRPRAFARALGAMAVEQAGPRGRISVGRPFCGRAAIRWYWSIFGSVDADIAFPLRMGNTSCCRHRVPAPHQGPHASTADPVLALRLHPQGRNGLHVALRGRLGPPCRSDNDLPRSGPEAHRGGPSTLPGRPHPPGGREENPALCALVPCRAVRGKGRPTRSCRDEKNLATWPDRITSARNETVPREPGRPERDRPGRREPKQDTNPVFTDSYGV